MEQAEPTASTIEAVLRFDNFTRHNVNALIAAMTQDCLFESTNPAPDGQYFVGQSAVRAVWEDLFRASPNALFETEEMFAAGDRWVYHWIDEKATKDTCGEWM